MSVARHYKVSTVELLSKNYLVMGVANKKHLAIHNESEGNWKASIQALTPPPKIAMNLGVLAT